MSKVSAYLQGHLLGQVSIRKDIREKYSQDSSVLSVTPEMVIFPQNVNDVRKTMRFVWQLAEKGHSLPVTARGHGSDITGASLGSGIVLDMSRHMNQFFEYDSKQKLLRAQPGASADSVQTVLSQHGAAIPPLVGGLDGTIGGAVASDSSSLLSADHGTMQRWTKHLEVVLDSGDVIQTSRLSKRALSKMTGKQGREADIYRGVDRILEDHAELIDKLRQDDNPDRSGYASIVDVKDKAGSIDLTPLFVGSQGTLGVIVEMILGADYITRTPSIAVLAFDSAEEARDIADMIAKTNPTTLEYYDGRLLQTALGEGKTYDWLGENLDKTKAVLWISYNSFSDRTKKRSLKKLAKLVEKSKLKMATSESVDSENLYSIRQMTDYTIQPPSQITKAGLVAIPNFYVPSDRFGVLLNELGKLEKTTKVQLPVSGSHARGVYSLYAPLSMAKVTDQQRLMKLLDAMVGILDKVGGAMVADGGEGRLLSRYARATWDEEYQQMTQEIKNLFDPHGVLNPLSKSEVELKALVSQLRKS